MFTERNKIPDRLHRVEAGKSIDDIGSLKAGHIYLTEEGDPKLYVADGDGTPVELAMRTEDWEGFEFIGPPEYMTSNGVATVIRCVTIPEDSNVEFRWFLPNGVCVFGPSLTFADHNIGEDESCYVQGYDQFGNQSNMTHLTTTSTMQSSNYGISNRVGSFSELYDNFRDGNGLVRILKPMNMDGSAPLNYTLTTVTSGVTQNIVGNYDNEAVYSYRAGPEPSTGVPHPNPQLKLSYIGNDGAGQEVLFDIPPVDNTVLINDPLITNLRRGELSHTEKLGFFYAVEPDGSYNISPLEVVPAGAANVSLLGVLESHSIWSYTILNDSSGEPFTDVSFVSNYINAQTGANESYTYEIPMGIGGPSGGGAYETGDGSGTLTPPGLEVTGGTGDTIEGGVSVSITGLPTNRDASHNMAALGLTFDTGEFHLTLPTDYQGVPYTYTIESNELIYAAFDSLMTGGKHRMTYHTVDTDDITDPATIEITFSDGSTMNLSMSLSNNPNPSYTRSDVDGSGDPIPFPVTDLGDSITVNTQVSDSETDGTIGKFVLTSYNSEFLSIQTGADRFNPGDSITLTAVDNPMNLGKVTKFYIASEKLNGNQSTPVEYIVTMKSAAIPSFIALSVTDIGASTSYINLGVGNMSPYKFMITRIENGIRNVANSKEWESADSNNNISVIATDGNAPVKVTVRVSRDGKILSGNKTLEWQVPRSDQSYDYSHEISSNASAVYSNWGDTLANTTSQMTVFDPHSNISGREWYEVWQYDADRIYVGNTDVWWQEYDGGGDISLSPKIDVNMVRDVWRIPAITNLNDDEWWWDNGHDLIVAWDDFDFGLGKESVKIGVYNDIQCTQEVYLSPELKDGQYKQHTIPFTVIDDALGHGWIKLIYKWNTPHMRVVQMRTHGIEFKWQGSGDSNAATFNYEDTNRKLTFGLDVVDQNDVSYGITSNPVIDNLGIRISLPEIKVLIDRDNTTTSFPIWDQAIRFYDIPSEVSLNTDPIGVNGTSPVKFSMFHDMVLYPNHHFRYRVIDVRKNGLPTTDISVDRSPTAWLEMDEVTTISPNNLGSDTYQLTIEYSLAGRRMIIDKELKFLEVSPYSGQIFDITNNSYNVPNQTAIWLIKAVGGTGGEDTVITGLTPNPIVATGGAGNMLGRIVEKEIHLHDTMSFHVVTGTATNGGWASIQKIS